MRLRATLRIALCICGAVVIASCATQDRRAIAAEDAKATLQVAHEQFTPALRLARAARANGDLASAINLYLSVVAIKPASPSIVVELGDTLVDAGSMDDAIDVYSKVDQSSPAWLGALLGLQQAYLKLGESEKALRYSEQATLLAPLDQRVLIGRGVTLDLLGRHTQAQASYRAVLAGAPHDIAARNNLALSLALTDQFADAIEIMTSMARSSTATPRIRQNLALIYGLAGDVPHAGALSRVDLDASTTAGNLRFFEMARNADPP